MRSGDEVVRELQKIARAEAASTGKRPATAELVARHGLESFLARLAASAHAPNFALKGGILIACYTARRRTRDIDSEVSDADLNPVYLGRVVNDVLAVSMDDGMTFSPAELQIEEIREDSKYSGLRLHLPARLGSQPVRIAWDVSTGDPVIPTPKLLSLSRLIGADIVLRGYAPETIVAEKGVTILQRGTASTRWRDYLDIVQLDRSQDLDPDLLRASALAVAAHRGISLEPVAPYVRGYGAIGQPKWSAWRRKNGVEDLCAADLEEQMAAVIAVLDPAFAMPRDEPGA